MRDRRLFRSTLTLLLGNVGGAALSFVLAALIGRALGRDGLGVYAVALAWIFPLGIAAEFGLNTLITREVAADLPAGPDMLRATTIPRLLLGGAAMCALWLLAPLISADSLVVVGLRLAAPLLLIQPWFGAFTALFRAESAMWPIPWLNVGMLAVQVALTAGALLLGGDVRAALAINTLTSAAQLFAAWAIYRARFRRPCGGNALPAARLLRRAWPFALAGILAALQARTATILLEPIAGAGEAGLYAAGARFVEAARMAPNALFGALLPALAALDAHPTERERTFRRTARGLALYGLAAGGLIALLAGPLIALVYGPGFDAAAPVLQIAALALLPSLLRSGRVLYGYARGREAFVNRVTALLLLVQAMLSAVLIPAGGAAGAALAVLITEAGAAVLLWKGLAHG